MARGLLVGLLGAALLLGCGKDVHTLKMVTEPTFPPFEFLRGHEVVGVDVEICRAIAAKLGKSFDALTVDFDAVIPSVISGKADLAAAGLTVTEDRRKSVDFSMPYVKMGIVVLYPKSRPCLSGAACKGKRIGVQSGTTSDEYVVSELKQEPERFRSVPEAVAALKSGRCDVVVCDQELAKNCTKGEPDLAFSDYITSEEYALAIRKGRPELLAAANETIAELKANGTLAKWVERFIREADSLKEK